MTSSFFGIVCAYHSSFVKECAATQVVEPNYLSVI